MTDTKKALKKSLALLDAMENLHSAEVKLRNIENLLDIDSHDGMESGIRSLRLCIADAIDVNPVLNFLKGN